MTVIRSHYGAVVSLIVYNALVISPTCTLKLAERIITIKIGMHLCSILSCFKTITYPDFISPRQLLQILNNLKLQRFFFNVLKSRGFCLLNCFALGLLSYMIFGKVFCQFPIGEIREPACLCKLAWSLFTNTAMMHWICVFGETDCV
jgi:hypothetical protein